MYEPLIYIHCTFTSTHLETWFLGNKFGYPTPDAAAGGRSLEKSNGWSTDGRTEGWTDAPSYRDAVVIENRAEIVVLAPKVFACAYKKTLAEEELPPANYFLRGSLFPHLNLHNSIKENTHPETLSLLKRVLFLFSVIRCAVLECTWVTWQPMATM